MVARGLETNLLLLLLLLMLQLIYMYISLGQGPITDSLQTAAYLNDGTATKS